VGQPRLTRIPAPQSPALHQDTSPLSEPKNTVDPIGHFILFSSPHAQITTCHKE